MLPQLVSLGPLTLNLYALLIALAVLAPLAWHWFRHRDAGVFALALVATLFALAFGRAGYVAMNWDYFREHPNEIVALSGLSEHAAILGGLVGWAVSCRLWADPRFTAHHPPPTAIVLIAIAASIGCIPNGCAYGREVFWQTDGEQSLAWLLRADWPDAMLVNNPRWPTQALLAAWVLVGGAILFAVTVTVTVTRRQGDKGTGMRHFPLVPLSSLHPVILVVVVWFAAGDFLVQFLRGDATPMPGGLRTYQWFDAALAGLAAALLIARRLQNSKQIRPLRARKFE